MKTYTVGQINGYIKNVLESDYLLSNFVVKGEISNCKYHSMGHIYFSLKDNTGSMPCVMFKGNTYNGLKFKLADGQSVIITGSIGVYERDGRYQLYAKKIELDGVGDLNLQYEMLKQKLYNEGLFEFDLKKPIPKFPKAVGIVTASTGAAIQDIQNVARRRNPYVKLYLYPAKVQGEGAAETIARGIYELDKMGLDIIIIGRGGGSIEDLWAFNEEIVARAIFAAKTPIISGTGHEVDNTIADYVADLRAPTPSAAAELAIPDVMTAVLKARSLEQEIKHKMDTKLNLYKLKLNSSLVFKQKMEGKLRVYNMTYSNLKLALDKASPETMLRERQLRLVEMSDRLSTNMTNRLNRSKNRYEVLVATLDGRSPLKKLINGFGYVSNCEAPVKSVSDVKKDDVITITMHDGEIKAVVD